jgi:hypothetical protein
VKNIIVAILSTVAGMTLLSAGVVAHHGASSVYDLGKSLNMTGTVTDYQFVNPHVLIFFEVTEDDGDVVVWSAGLTSPNRLARSDQWTKDSLKIGDEVTVIGAPARGGAPSLWVEQVLLDGSPMLGQH